MTTLSISKISRLNCLQLIRIAVSQCSTNRNCYKHSTLHAIPSTIMHCPRILSIQSHVVSGYVGNKCATFPLQLLGFEVDTINSVQFSNHTGYPKFTGQVLSDLDLDELFQGLTSNNLDKDYTYLLTGYIGSPKFLLKVAEIVRHLKTTNPNLIYVCDPVMGDNGKMYVPDDLLPLYKSEIVSLADILTPNQFEAELLTDSKINDEESAWNAIDFLHEKGCATIVLSSTNLGSKDTFFTFASTLIGGKQRFTLEIPTFPASFTGTGDLFAATFLAWMHKTNHLQSALEHCIATLQAVLKRTLASSQLIGTSTKSLELKLIESKADIETPKITIKAKIAK